MVHKSRGNEKSLKERKQENPRKKNEIRGKSYFRIQPRAVLTHGIIVYSCLKKRVYLSLFIEYL